MQNAITKASNYLKEHLLKGDYDNDSSYTVAIITYALVSSNSVDQATKDRAMADLEKLAITEGRFQTGHTKRGNMAFSRSRQKECKNLVWSQLEKYERKSPGCRDPRSVWPGFSCFACCLDLYSDFRAAV